MKKYLLIIGIVLIIFTFVPGVTKEEALTYLNSTEYIVKQHDINGRVLEEEIATFFPIPFGAVATTYEGMWFIPFWKT